MFKFLKQELLFIPLMLVLMEVLRNTLSHFYPDTALFDRGSEVESFFFRVWQIVWITSASWLLLRVVFPSAYRALKRWYFMFSDMPEQDQRNMAVKLFFVFFFGLVFLLSGRAGNEEGMRAKLMDTLNSQLYVREATGNNDGIEVEKYLNFVGRQKGDAWCAAFASWNLNAIGVSTPPNPKSGWSPNFANKTYIIWSAALNKQHKAKQPKKGDCFTLYYSSIGRVGHVGFIIDETPSYFITIEGNTGLTGSREGSGVHKYKRAKSKVFAITNYITPYLTNYEKSNTITNRFSNNDVLQNKASTINRNQYEHRKNNIVGLYPRFYFVKGFNYKSERRQFENYSQCNNQQGGGNNSSGNKNKLAENGTFSGNNKWKSLFVLCMQRFGITSSVKGAAHSQITFKSIAQNFNSTKNNTKKSRNTLYS